MNEEKSIEQQGGDGFSNFVSFKKFISTTIIQILYAIGVLFITFSGINTIFKKQAGYFGGAGYDLGDKLFWGLLIIFVGNLIWRIFCEGVIVMFSMHDLLASIEREIKKQR